MASLDRDEAPGRFHIRFRYGGREFKRSLKVRDCKDPRATLWKVATRYDKTARNFHAFLHVASVAILLR